MDITTTAAMILFFLAGGITTARNMPYIATLIALMTGAGRIMPTIVPRKVPSTQPGAATLAAPY